MDLYIRRGLVLATDPEVRELSRLLIRLGGGDPVADPDRYRNPSAVHLQLTNFVARLRPGQGTSDGNKFVALVWERFHDRHDLLRAEAAAIRDEIEDGQIIRTEELGRAKIGFLQPFAPKADLFISGRD